MISLFPFQLDASTNIADRYRDFITDIERPRLRGYGPLPFYQSLYALTGAGKTPILADAIAQMRTVNSIEPVILWVSKAKVVVEQTLSNFEDGGKYHHLIEGFSAMPLPDCTPQIVEDATYGLLLLGTAGTFNSKEKGDRRIYQVRRDVSDIALWDALITRLTTDGRKRPLIVFYDEGHNLTDQQTNLLLELRPDAFIVASATPKLPGELARLVEALKIQGYGDAMLGTGIRSTDVVEAGLVKREVQLGGYVTAEEAAISAMLADYDDLRNVALSNGAPFVPKCIYVCDTNIRGDELKPFDARCAPPIRIWRYLVETCKVDPAEIAVYCDLKVFQTQPLPSEFTLFRGGENDYSKFIAGNYKHIIFNLSLQEGWDDPECYLAYIDKSMGSKIQVEQIIGRVLRQPGATHYTDAKLNTAGFYIHVTAEGVFKDILREVQSKLSVDMPAVVITSTGGSTKTMISQPPLIEKNLPSIGVDSEPAHDMIAEEMAKVSDYTNSQDALAKGRFAQFNQEIGQKESTSDLVWQERGEGLTVSVEWLLKRFIDRQCPAAASACDFDEPRFRCRVQIGSRAAQQLEDQADKIVQAYINFTEIAVTPGDTRKIGDATLDLTSNVQFDNAIHPAYSGLDADEIECAKAIDLLGWRWYRNPSNGGLRLPLLIAGTTRGFDPDFIIWTDAVTWLVDPKGKHLIKEAAARKLLDIDSAAGQLPLKVCLTTQGKWNENFSQLSEEGVTAWRRKSGGYHRPEHYPDFNTLLRKVVGAKG